MNMRLELINTKKLLEIININKKLKLMKFITFYFFSTYPHYNNKSINNNK